MKNNFISNQTDSPSTSICFESVENIVSKIDAISNVYPEKDAMVFRDRQISFRQLKERSDKLAAKLVGKGISRGKPVGVSMCQSPERIIAMFAILKAGGSYLILENNLPLSRVETMVQDSGTTLVLVDDEQVFKDRGLKIDFLEWKQDTYKSYSDELTNPIVIDKQQPAYIIYTSGSTGVPKGVVIHHEALSQFVEAFGQLGDFSLNDRFIQFGSPSFDVSIIDIWIPLSIGATIVLYPDNKIIGEPLLEFIVKNDINVIPSLTPTVMATLPSDHYIGVLNKVILVGEVPAERVVKEWKDRVKLYNVYGPTETTVASAVYLYHGDSKASTIGRAIPGTDLYILDQALQAVPQGNEGELFIGGKQLSKGYLNKPHETAKVFIEAPDWLKAIKGQDYKLYKSGDRVMLNANHDVEFIGRLDDQVKLRGYRIELKEIEHHIRQLGDFPNVSVTMYRPKDKLPILAAFVETKPGDDATVLDIKNRLKGLVPVYMLPDKVIPVERLPITITGKVDKRELEARLDEIFVNKSNLEKSDDFQEELVRIWKDLLGLDYIDATSNFFELGGHSLMVAQLHGRLPKEIKKMISLPEIYNYPTIDSFIKEVQQRTEQNRININHRALRVQEQLIADAQLPEGFKVEGKPNLLAYANPENILLTGVTGFVGSQLLVEIIKLNPTSKIHCLVRAQTPAMGMERIKSTFLKFSIPWERDFERQVNIILGDIEEEYLGMTLEDYTKLAELIDVVYHMASNVSYIQPYDIIKKPNVYGTQNILLFSTAEKLKLLVVSSSIGVYSWGRAFTGKTWMTEEEAIEQNLPAVSRDMGYIRSKWVMDKIVSLAREQGLPVMNFRLGFVVSHSKTGATPLNQWWSSMMRSCIELNSFPLIMALKDQVITVDYVCEAMAYIAKNMQAIGLNFNLVPQPEHDLSLTDFCVRIAEYCSIEMKGVDYHDWFKIWDGNEEIPVHSLLYLFNEEVYEGKTMIEVYENTYYVKSTNTLKFLEGSEIKQSVFNKDVIQAYVKFMKMA